MIRKKKPEYKRKTYKLSIKKDSLNISIEINELELIESDSSSLYEIEKHEFEANVVKNEDVCAKSKSHEASENSSSEQEII